MNRDPQPGAADAAGQPIDGAEHTIPRDSLTGLGVLVPARSYPERLLVEMWERILKVVPIGVEDHWFDLGGDSLGAAVLFAEIEAGFGQKLPLASLLEADTVAKLARMIDPRPAMRNQPALVFNAAGGRAPLFCVHGVHGTADFAALLSRHLGSEQPIIGFQARGLAERSEPHASVERIAAVYLAVLRRHRQRGPYHLIGWCVGALIAFEMARRLIAEHEEIGRLILVDPPVRPFREGGMSPVDEAIARLRNMEVKSDLAGTYRDAVIRVVEALGRAGNSYRFQPYPGDLAILCSEENYSEFMDQASEWRVATQGSVSVRSTAPTHLSLVREGVPELATEIRRLLG